MSTLNQVYVSNGVPFGGFSATFYRPTDKDHPGTNPTSLGTYIVETLTPSHEGIMINRPAVDGGDNGWALVDGPITGSITIQLNTSTSTTLLNGDYFVASDSSIEADASSAPNGGAAVSRRFVIVSPSVAVGMTEYRKQNANVRVDKFNS